MGNQRNEGGRQGGKTQSWFASWHSSGIELVSSDRCRHNGQPKDWSLGTKLARSEQRLKLDASVDGGWTRERRNRLRVTQLGRAVAVKFKQGSNLPLNRSFFKLPELKEEFERVEVHVPVALQHSLPTVESLAALSANQQFPAVFVRRQIHNQCVALSGYKRQPLLLRATSQTNHPYFHFLKRITHRHSPITSHATLVLVLHLTLLKPHHRESSVQTQSPSLSTHPTSLHLP